jgi:hypothetical protein
MLALNLSGTTLNDAKFIDFLLNELTAASVPGGALCFEITETAAIANLGQVVRFMNMLKEYGVRFSLDDFGTGLSSLTYLKNLPVDFVKIDGAFIRNVTRDPVDQSMVEAITQMARALKVHTIAERVESRAVLTRLGEIGVTFAQGYFVAVPQPVTELPLQRHQTLVADAVAEASLIAAAAAASGNRTMAAAVTAADEPGVRRRPRSVPNPCAPARAEDDRLRRRQQGSDPCRWRKRRFPGGRDRCCQDGRAAEEHPPREAQLLGPADPPPVETWQPDEARPIVVVCDHAGRAIPKVLGNLGVSAQRL